MLQEYLYVLVMPDVLQLAVKGVSVVLRQIDKVVHLALQVGEVVSDDYFVCKQSLNSPCVPSLQVYSRSLLDVKGFRDPWIIFLFNLRIRPMLGRLDSNA